MKKILTLTLLVASFAFVQAKNDKQVNGNSQAACMNCETTAPCVDCDAPEAAPCLDCDVQATPCLDCETAAPCMDCDTPEAMISRKEARREWKAMSKEEKRMAKSTVRQILEHTPLGMAASELKQQIDAHKASKNTASTDAMQMDPTIRILIIVALILLCLILLLRII
jgi:hypothetical protein